MADYKDLDRKVIKLSKQIVRMCTEAGSGHPSSALVAGAPDDGTDVSRHALRPQEPVEHRRRPAGALRGPRRAGRLRGLLRPGRRGRHARASQRCCGSTTP